MSSLLRSFIANGQINAATATISLPEWMAIACATTSRTSQTSATTIVPGFGANAARGYSVDGTAWYLLGENAGANLLTKTETFGSWNIISTGSVTADTLAAPDGATTADTLTWPGNDKGIYALQNSPANTKGVSTLWMQKQGSNTQLGQWDVATGYYNKLHTLTTSWARGEKAFAGNASGTYFGFGSWGGNPIGSGTAYIWGAQVEDGVNYPSNYMPGDTSAFTRAADVMTLAGSAFGTFGLFDFNMVLAPLYANGEQAGNHTLFDFNDGLTKAILRQSDNKVVFTVNGGTSMVSSALTWSRNQAITIRCTNKKTTSQSLIVSGATTGNGTTTGGAGVRVTIPSTIYLGGGSSGCEESAGFGNVNIYSPCATVD